MGMQRRLRIDGFLKGGWLAICVVLDRGSSLLLRVALAALVLHAVLVAIALASGGIGGGGAAGSRARLYPPPVAHDRAFFVPTDLPSVRVLGVEGGSGQLHCEILEGRLPPGMALRTSPGSIRFEGSARGWGWYEARIRITDTGCMPFESRTVTVRFRVGA